jgi:hypothetical protein
MTRAARVATVARNLMEAEILNAVRDAPRPKGAVPQPQNADIA